MTPEQEKVKEEIFQGCMDFIEIAEQPDTTPDSIIARMKLKGYTHMQLLIITSCLKRASEVDEQKALPAPTIPESNGTLENWYKRGEVYCGQIYGDTKGRFQDGEMIHTSRVVSRDDYTIRTLNSIYTLGDPHIGSYTTEDGHTTD